MEQKKHPWAWIKDARKKAGLTQFEVATRCGVSVMAFQLWERSGMQPKPDNLEKLKSVLGIR